MEEEEDLISAFGILEKQQRILKQHVLFNFMNLNESHKKSKYRTTTIVVITNSYQEVHQPVWWLLSWKP